MELQEWKLKNKKRRNYAHFDPKVSLDRVWSYISDPRKIASHGFYPFIHYTLSFLKYNKETGLKPKTREICYSAHIDRYIYQYYGFKLNQLYNARVKLDCIEDSAIAYRDNLHKNNIHFAKAAFDFIKGTEECYVIIGDFTKFFDSLNHNYLKERLCSLLCTERLPDDYYAVFKNITKYSTWDLTVLLELNGLENNVNGIQSFNQLEKAISSAQFKELKNKFVKPNKDSFGIPQGSAISAVLSNIYMLDFDKKIKDYVTEKQGLYMRYSDDFIVILPSTTLVSFKSNFQFINLAIQSVPRVKLEPEKTQIFEYNRGVIKSCNEDILQNVKNGKNFINYLGFTFDGRAVTLRDKTVSKYYYRLYRKLKTIVKRNGITKKGKRISCENVYLKYSIKGANVGNGSRGNFITYVKKAERIFSGEKAIGHVRKKHMQKIRKQLNQIK
ncbi:reverse transcriptase/maturase family protein [Paenibacillus humicus]|uniref:reverse transcriptase/maturase family protein n=1 Tax=Paenibacillus humicus TaxID=412861 RepID=UPI000FDA3323|nr:reverse transcriptase/maturase family protein [Paenibacillus humicus]